jgi:hypothetical protein
LTLRPTFGALGVCNGATIYGLLFVNVRATVGSLRWIFVAVAVMAFFVSLHVPTLALWKLGRNQAVRDEQAESNSMDVVRVGESNALERSNGGELAPGLAWAPNG